MLLHAKGLIDHISLKLRIINLQYFNKQTVHVENFVNFGAENYCACVGTLIYKSQIGKAALQKYYQDFLSNSIVDDDLYGAYCIVIHYAGKLYLRIDALEVYKIFETQQCGIISSSFLALLASSKKKTVNTQCLYEYIFQGATYGGETVIREIELIDQEKIQNTQSLYSLYNDISANENSVTPNSFESALKDNLEQLNRGFSAISDCFGNNIDTALSGGYDSRLTLALLNSQNITPNLHVYGSESDADVTVAKEIAASEGLHLAHIDKGTSEKLAVKEYQNVIEQNMQVFDGFPVDGIFNSGADIQARKARCSNGEVMLNGGGGEIYRNFFYVLNKSIGVKSMVWTFYSQYDPLTTTDRFLENKYQENFSKKIKRCLGTTNDQISREDIDLLYPKFRCRYWMGKNNSINNRFGYALTPFIEGNVVKEAAKINPQYKNHGVFEAALIAQVNPSLAGYRSGYGFNFTEGPSLKHKLKDYCTYLRPPWLRRYTFRIRTRRMVLQRPWYLAEDLLDSVLPDQFAYLKEYLYPTMLKDNAQFNRACTLEYLFRRFSPTISFDM